MANKKDIRSSRKDRTGRNPRRAAGMPAKAGRRKVYTTGTRKTKNFGDGEGYQMTNTVDLKDKRVGKVIRDRINPGEPLLRDMTAEEIQTLFY